MNLFESDVRTIKLERYSIEREAIGQPVTVRAELIVSAPSAAPSALRIRVKYQVPEMPKPANEKDFGRRLLQLLGNQLDTRTD